MPPIRPTTKTSRLVWMLAKSRRSRVRRLPSRVHSTRSRNPPSWFGQKSSIRQCRAFLGGPGLGGVPTRILLRYCAGSGPLAHPEEQGTFNPKVPGSRPGRPTSSPWSPWPRYLRALAGPGDRRLHLVRGPYVVDRGVRGRCPRTGSSGVGHSAYTEQGAPSARPSFRFCD
jgi:hypothetical protein